MMEPKKNPILDSRKKSGLFFNIGLAVSLLLVIFAFEWKFVQREPTVDLMTGTSEPTFIDVKITDQKPPPPKIKNFNVVEVKEEPQQKFEIEFPPIFPEDNKIEDIGMTEAPPEKADDPPFHLVETMPSFDHDGYVGFLKYVSKNLKYPGEARRHNVEGKVFVQFIVDRDGRMTDIKVVRGLGYGCDEEVMRVLKKAPAWEPGKQRGEPVRVIMILPIAFKLN